MIFIMQNFVILSFFAKLIVFFTRWIVFLTLIALFFSFFSQKFFVFFSDFMFFFFDHSVFFAFRQAMLTSSFWVLKLIDAFQNKLFSLWFLNVIEIKTMKMKLQKSFFEQISLQKCDQKFHVMFFFVNFRLIKVILLSLSHRICKSKFSYQSFHSECADQKFFSYVISYNQIRLMKLRSNYKFERSCWCFEDFSKTI